MSDLDTTKIGLIAAEFMEILSRQDDDDDVVAGTLALGEIVILGEVRWQTVDDDGDTEEHITVLTASTTDNRIHQTGIVRWGQTLIEDTGTPMQNGEDEED